MNAIWKKSLAGLDQNLGRCPICMRQSFVFMLGTCCLAIIIELTVRSAALHIAGRIVAVISIGLWLSHLVAFSLRATTNTKTKTPNFARKNSGTNLEHWPRRQFLLLFAKNFALIAVAIAVPVRSAFAQGRCQCSGFTPKCCYSTFDWVCAPSDAICCADSQGAWSCPNGHYCTGDHGGCT